MDNLTFISNLIDHLVWPTLLLVLILVLRKPIADLIRNIELFKYKDLIEIQFGNKVDEVEKRAEEENIIQMPTAAITQRLAESEQLFQLVERYPGAAVLEAWKEVEHALVDAARRLDPPLRQGRPLELMREMVNRGLIESPMLEIAGELRNLRNMAVHARAKDLRPGEVIRYHDMATGLAGKIRESIVGLKHSE